MARALVSLPGARRAAGNPTNDSCEGILIAGRLGHSDGVLRGLDRLLFSYHTALDEALQKGTEGVFSRTRHWSLPKLLRGRRKRPAIRGEHLLGKGCGEELCHAPPVEF